MIEVKVIDKTMYGLPKYETEFSAGFDLKANLPTQVVIRPMERILVPTGLFVEIPAGYEMQVRPRSGLAIKHGITVLNTPGTIDSDYRGQICVILINLSDKEFTINPGDRIAQGVITNYERAEFVVVDTLSDTERGTGGFGHSGIK